MYNFKGTYNVSFIIIFRIVFFYELIVLDFKWSGGFISLTMIFNLFC